MKNALICFSHLFKVVEGHADGECSHAHRAPVVLDQHALAVHTAAQPPLAARHEVLGVRVNVKANQITAK